LRRLDFSTAARAAPLPKQARTRYLRRDASHAAGKKFRLRGIAFPDIT